MARLDSQQIEAARGFFSSERLIRSNDGGWQTARSVFQQNDEDTPGVAIIHHSVADLSIWDRLEVPRRPTLELAVEWLKQIPPDSRPVGQDRERIRQILRRAPNFVARQCGQWLDLTGRWTAIAQLHWVTFTRSVESGLFPNIRQATADLSMVDQFTIDSTPFAEVPILETELRRRITCVEFAVKQEPPAWIQALSKGLLRIQWTEDDQAGESPKLAYLDNQEQARRLLATRWLPIKSIEVTPYLDETPAGEARSPHVVWNERDLYVVADGPRYHRELVEELQRQFSLAEVRDAIADCIERPAAWIEDYLAAHFTLGPELAEWSQNDDEEAATAEPVENAEANGKNNHEVRLEDVERRAAELTEKTETAASTDTPPVTEPTPTIENDVPSVTPGKPALTREDRVVAYMKRLGFQWDPLRKIFVDKRGNTVRQAERPFHWMIVDVAGQVRDRYWIGHKSFEAGLEIAAEVWEAMKHLPKSSWLLLPKEDGSLQAYRWSRVNERVQAGEIMLFAATYRIRLSDTEVG